MWPSLGLPGRPGGAGGIYKSYDRGEFKIDNLQTNILIHTAAGGVSKVANFNSLLDSPAYEFYLFNNQVCHLALDSFFTSISAISVPPKCSWKAQSRNTSF